MIPRVRSVYLPTFSDTDQLLACTFPYGREIERETSHEADFGIQAHAAFSEFIKNTVWSVRGRMKPPKPPKVMDDPTRRAYSALKALLEWLPRCFDQWGAATAIETESSYSINIVNWQPNEIGQIKKTKNPDPKTHEYPGRKSCDFPGTLDLLLVFNNEGEQERWVVVLDAKFGKDTPTPQQSGQLMSQALAAATFHNATDAIIGFVHAPEDGEPIIITDEIAVPGLWKHGYRVREAWKRIGDGSLRPWTKEDEPKADWCTYCKTRSICPVGSRDIVVIATDALGLAVVEGGKHIIDNGAYGKIIPRTELGRIIKQRSAINALNEKLGPMIQADIEANGPAIYDGKIYDVEETAEFETVSAGSIKRALGLVKAEREMTRLRKLGCTEVQTRKRIQGRKYDG